EAVAGGDHYRLPGRGELRAEARAHAPPAGAPRVAEEAAGLPGWTITLHVGGVAHGVLEHDAVVVQRLAELVAQPLGADRPLTRHGLRGALQRLLSVEMARAAPLEAVGDAVAVGRAKQVLRLRRDRAQRARDLGRHVQGGRELVVHEPALDR